MKKKKEKNRKITSRRKKVDASPRDQSSIRVGNISGGVGFAIGSGAKADVTQFTGNRTDEISQAFGVLRQKTKELPEGPDKSIAENTIQALEVEAKKGEQANENNIEKWMNFLADTAPDVWEVALDTFTNPIKGISTVFMKIAKKAKAERDAKRA